MNHPAQRPSHSEGRRGKRLSSLLLALSAVLVLGACKDKEIVGPPSVFSVDVRVDTVRLVITDTLRATAVVTGSDGNVLTDRQVSWSASPASVLESLGDGVFVGSGVGNATITATAAGQSGSTSMEVFQLDLQDNVVQADQVLELLSDSTELESSTLRFSKLADTVSFAVGDVVFGNEGGGFGRVVTNVVADGSEVVLDTRPATLQELVKDGVVEVMSDASLGAALRRVGSTGQGYLKAPPRGITLSPDGVFHFENAELPFFDVSGSLNGLTVSVTVDGTAQALVGSELIPGTDAVYATARTNWSKVPPLRHLYTVATVGMELDVDVTTSVTGSLISQGAGPLRREVDLLKTTLHKGMAGPVQYSINLGLRAYTQIDANVKGSVTSGLTMVAGGQAWMNWTPGGGFTNGFVPRGSAELKPPQVQLEGNTGVRFGLEPYLEIEFFEGLADAEGGVDGYFDAGFGANLYEWNADTRFQVDAYLSAGVDGWGLIGIDQRWTVAELWTLPLGSSSGPLSTLSLSPTAVYVTVGTAEDVTATAISNLTNISLGSPTIDWSSADPDIATVSTGGVVSGVALGETTVTGTIRGTGVSATVPVTVGSTPKLRIGACIVNSSGGCGPDNPVLNRGATFRILFGVDNPATGNAVCGATVTIENPFTGDKSAWVTPSPTCLGSLDFVVPTNAAAGSYQMNIGPGSAEGFVDANVAQLPFTVN